MYENVKFFKIYLNQSCVLLLFVIASSVHSKHDMLVISVEDLQILQDSIFIFEMEIRMDAIPEHIRNELPSVVVIPRKPGQLGLTGRRLGKTELVLESCGVDIPLINSILFDEHMLRDFLRELEEIVALCNYQYVTDGIRAVTL